MSCCLFTGTIFICNAHRDYIQHKSCVPRFLAVTVLHGMKGWLIHGCFVKLNPVRLTSKLKLVCPRCTLTIQNEFRAFLMSHVTLSNANVIKEVVEC